MCKLSSYRPRVIGLLSGAALAAIVLTLAPTQAQAHRHHCCWGRGVAAGVVGSAALWGWPGSHYLYGPYPYGAPVTIVAPPVGVVVQPAAPAYYYCPKPQGYYPYVPNCQVPWQVVSANPPPVR